MGFTPEEELDLWNKSKSGDRDASKSLLRSVMPHVHKRVSRYRDVPIPAPALYGEATKMALTAIQNWDPTRGARLGTHTVTQLQRMNRFVSQNKNIARIPEHRAVKIGGFLHTRDALSAELGRAPSPEEMADELSWPVKEVRATAASMRKDLSESGMPEAALAQMNDRQKETMNFVRFSLTHPEQKVFDSYFVTTIGKAPSVTSVAKNTGKSEDWVYRVRRRLVNDIKRYS